MEFLDYFSSLFVLKNFIFVILGVITGVCFGAVPGLDATTGTALVIPLTYAMSPEQALFFLGALYVGGVFGGSITAILFRVPGASEAVMTTLDGYPMAQKGQGGKALGVSITSSSLGGTFAVVVALLLTAPLATIALSFGPAEYFALAVLGLSSVVSVGVKSQLKALIGVCIGLLAATVGGDAIAGIPRFTFGSEQLFSGIPFIPAIIGLFAASEVFSKVSQGYGIEALEPTAGSKPKAELMKIKEIIKMKWTILRGAIIGTWIGILPGVGATTAAIIGYTQEVRFSKHPEKFGTGIPEGIAAPEAANNSAAVGAMVPLLALGIPGSATAAVLIGAFMIHGLTPGPLLLVNKPGLMYSILGSMFFANFLIVLVGLLAAKVFVKLLNIPYPIMATSIMTICVIGAMSLGDAQAVLLMFVFGIGGYFMNKYDYPSAPIILGLVLGPILEVSLRKALMIAGQDFVAVASRPITAFLLVASVLMLLSPVLPKIFAGKRQTATDGNE